MMRWLAAAGVLVAAGCGNLDPPPPQPFSIFMKVESDPGRPVSGAVVFRNSKPIGTTGPDGRTMLTLPGAEGEITDVTVKCPDTYTSPTKPTSIRLTRLVDKTKVPEYAVSCPPTVRHVVVAVKADNGPHLPVIYLNRAVTRTDASGAAHFALEVTPGAQFQVTLDTTEKGNERLKPQNPSRPFTVGQQDDILLFEQKFDVEKKPVFIYKPNIPRALN